MTILFSSRFGSDKVKKEFLEPSVNGDVVSSIGVSEPGGGSDVARYFLDSFISLL